jgi:hypothetical protein
VLTRTARRLRAAMTGESAKKVLVGAVLLLIGASFDAGRGAVSKALAHHPGRLANVAPFLPPNYRVTRRLDVDMDESGTPEAVVVAIGVPGKMESPPTKIIILSWDGEAARWTTVFDSSQRGRGFRGQPFLPTDIGVYELQILPIQGRPGHRDLAIAATLSTGIGGSWESIAILTFQNEVIDFGYDYRGTATGAISVVGKGPSQQLHVTASFHTPLNAHCCPVRDYTFDVAFLRDDGLPVYEEITDDRPWLGTYVLADDLPGLKVLEVAEVIGKTPLRPGDLVIQVGDVRFSPKREQPQVIDDLAQHVPNQTVKLVVQRGRSKLSFDAPLLSRLTEFATRPDLLTIPEVDGTLTSTGTGVIVKSVKKAGVAALAGLLPGDVILGCDSYVVGRVADLNYAFLWSPANSSLLTIRRRGRALKLRIKPRYGYPELPSIEPELAGPQPLEIF